MSDNQEALAQTAGLEGGREVIAGLSEDEAAGSMSDGACVCVESDFVDGIPNEELLYDLADLFKVFADTTRIKILFALMARPMPVGELAEAIGATQSAVSHQLRQLKQAHLVKFQRDGKSVIYSLSDDHVYTMLAQGMTHICE